MHSGSIYFLGHYRPAHFEADTLQGVACLMLTSIRTIEDTELRDWLRTRIHKLVGEMERAGDSCTALQSEHCNRGVSFARRPHDSWLDNITKDMRPCPGLWYWQD